jgi:HTH-type transcriptional regulator/antitoxin HigA
MDSESPKVAPMPGMFIREELEKRNWTQEDLASVLGRQLSVVSRIITGKTSITTDTALALAQALGHTPEFWLNAEAAYQLSRAEKTADDVHRRAHLYEIAPVKEMEKRGWIKAGGPIEEQERAICQFFEIGSIDEPPHVASAMRRSSPTAALSPSQTAWCFRARQLTRTMPIDPFDERQMRSLNRDLRILAAYPAEAKNVPAVMQGHGIRFVVVEHLSGSRVDGAAFWLDEQSPSIAVSLRLDRIDNFWFTLMHECSHIEHHDAVSIDVEMGQEERVQPLMKEDIERRADEDAAAALVPPDELDSFIRRIGPIYAEPNIIQFAHRIKMHPGIIVGQLQHRAEIGFGSHKSLQPKIRAHVISTALTDGWGVELAPGSA